MSHSNGLFDVSYAAWPTRFSSLHRFPLRLLISWSLSFLDDDVADDSGGGGAGGVLWAGLYIGTNAAGLWKPGKQFGTEQFN